jgi:2-methylcitrate dehydratase PrpD
MSPNTGFAGETLAAFVARSRWDDLPSSLRHEAKRALLNFLGCAIGAAHAPAVETAVQVLARFSGSAQAMVIGRNERLDMLSASFVNAISANLLDYDDTHLDTVIHPTAPVAPGLLALAETHGLPGRDVLHALLLGMEVECRLGNAVSPHHYARGWHITATCGVFGAAAASAKLLSLDQGGIWNALGIAASTAAGIVENLPTTAKNVGVGNAARNGLFAALLAQAGYAAAPAAIEGRFGWAQAAGDTPDRDAIGRDLGRHWEAARNTYKPYPCGIVLHPVIDACLELRARGLQATAVRSVLVRGPRLLLERGDRAVANERDARVSIHHSAAVALLFGAAGVREYTAPIVAAPEVAALRARVTAAVDARLPAGAASVTVETTDGAQLTATVTAARGSETKPLTDAEITEKVRACGAAPGIDRMIEQVWQLDALADLRPLTHSAAGPS